MLRLNGEKVETEKQRNKSSMKQDNMSNETNIQAEVKNSPK